jgi:hypothetical protein
MYIDADMFLSPDLVQSCMIEISKNECVALYIHEMILGKSIFSKVRRFERQFYTGTSIDAARFFFRDAFIKTRGFDEELFKSGSGEDWDLDKKIKLKGKIHVLPQGLYKGGARGEKQFMDFANERGVSLHRNWTGILHNESELSLSKYLRKKAHYSMGFNGYIRKWGRDDVDIKNQFSISYRFLLVFLENGKWKISMRNPLGFIGTIALKFAVGVVTFRKWRR